MIKVNNPLEDIFELSYDSNRRYVIEKIKGKWTIEDYGIYDEFYRNEFYEVVRGMKNWIKVLDMREYEVSILSDCIKTHLDWCMLHGLKHCVFIVPSAIVKIQMKRCNEEHLFNTYFYSEEEAFDFLRTLVY